MGAGSTTLICFGVCFGFFMLTGLIGGVLIILGRREEARALEARSRAKAATEGDRPG